MPHPPPLLMNIGLVCSAGGHLTEILQLRDAYEEFDHFFLTFKRQDSSELPGRVYYVSDPKRNPFSLVKNVLHSMRVFFRERPDVVITTGAGVAVPFCVLARLWGKQVVYIESFCRIEKPSLTGRLLYPIATLFLVQWESLLKQYGSKARFWGTLI